MYQCCQPEKKLPKIRKIVGSGGGGGCGGGGGGGDSGCVSGDSDDLIGEVEFDDVGNQ